MTAAPDLEVAPPVLDAIKDGDRCDRCLAQAHVRWVRGAQRLDLCAHHSREHRKQLLAWSHFSMDNTDEDGFPPK
jgi:hypothetical protein